MNTFKQVVTAITASEPEWGKYILESLPGLLISTIIGVSLTTFVSIKILKNNYILTIKPRKIGMNTLKVTALSIPIRLILIILTKVVLKYYFWKNNIK